MPTKYELVFFYSQNIVVFSDFFYSFAILRDQIGSSRIKSDETGSIISTLPTAEILSGKNIKTKKNPGSRLEVAC